MAQQYNLGKVVLTPRGAYSGSASYNKLDVFTYNGSSYMVLQSVTGVTPPNDTYYQVIAQKGTDGQNGSAATISAGSVTMLPVGSSATVANSGTSSNAIFDFGIPKETFDTSIIAADYDSTKTYSFGDYCIYNGDLKKATVDITSAEAYTAAHWTDAVIGSDLTPAYNTSQQNSCNRNVWNYGKVTDKKGVASDGSLTNNSSFKTTDYIPVHEGDVIYGYGSRFACYDSDKVFVAGTSFVLNTISSTTYPQMINGMHYYVIPSGVSYFRICANKTTVPDQFNCRIADGYTADPDKQFKFCGYLDALGKTRLRDCLDSGWYSCGEGYTSSITDLPDEFSGSVFLKVLRGTHSPSQTYIRQVLSMDSGRELTRILYQNGSTITDWYESSFSFNGYLNILGYTSLSSCLYSGWYSCAGSYTSNINDLPTGFPSNSAIHLEVFKRTNSSSQIYIRQIIISNNGKQWFRILNSNGTVSQDWTPIGNGITSTATAVIIGASIEAGTTHETASSGAVINASKAYLTVALQRNGVTVTNLSHGGMGFITTASDQTVFKTLLDSTDFSAYDSCYLVLGSNDWYTNKTLGSTTDTAGDTTVCAMLRYTIEKVYTSNPHIKLFVKLPDIRATRGDASTQWGYGANNSASTPYSLGDMANSYKTICAEYGVEVFGGLGTGIANVLNVQTVFPDNTHPSQKTMALMADDMTGRITFR